MASGPEQLLKECSYRFLLESPACKLTVIQVGIETTLRQKLLVGPLFDDAAMIHDKDQVRVSNSREPVGNNKACSAFHQLAHRLLNENLCSGIDAASGLIKYQDRRIGQKRASNGEQLLLSLRDVGCFLI